MLKEKALANTLAILTAGFYFGCRLLAGIAPDLLKTIGQSWFHSWDFSSLSPKSVTLSEDVLGFVTVVGLSWLTGLIFAKIYNRLAK